MQHTPEDFACPVCKQIDRVEKVSAAYEAGTSIGTYSGGSVGVGLAGGVVGVGMSQTNMSGLNQTNRSLRLAPPPQPLLQQGGGCGMGGLIFLCLLAALIGIGAVATDDNTARLVGATLIIAGAAGFTSLLVVTNRDSRIKKAEHAQQIARWRIAVANWERLYYCSRNDIVFVPGNPETCVPAYELYRLL